MNQIENDVLNIIKLIEELFLIEKYDKALNAAKQGLLLTKKNNEENIIVDIASKYFNVVKELLQGYYPLDADDYYGW